MVTHNIRDAATSDRPSVAGGSLIVVISCIVSILSYGALAENMRIHYRWTIGSYSHYGPEYAPTVAVLAAFPVIIAGVVIGFYWLGNYLDQLDDSNDLRLIFDGIALATLVMLVSVQIALILANIYL